MYASVEWSDHSVPVQKYTFGSLSLLKRDTVCSSEREHAGQSTHSPLTRFSQCIPFDKFPNAWLSCENLMTYLFSSLEKYFTILMTLPNARATAREICQKACTGKTLSMDCVWTDQCSLSRCCEPYHVLIKITIRTCIFAKEQNGLTILRKHTCIGVISFSSTTPQHYISAGFIIINQSNSFYRTATTVIKALT